MDISFTSLDDYETQLDKLAENIDPRKDPSSTGWRIRDERTNHWNNERTSQEALSKAVRVSKQTVTNWESGRSVPTETNFESLAALFGCSVGYLKGQIDDREPAAYEYEKQCVEKYAKSLTAANERNTILLNAFKILGLNVKDISGISATADFTIGEDEYIIHLAHKDNFDKLRQAIETAVVVSGIRVQKEPLTIEDIERLERGLEELRKLQRE